MYSLALISTKDGVHRMRAWAAEIEIENYRTGKAKRHRLHVLLKGEDLLHIRRHRDYTNISEVNGVATILCPVHGRYLLAFRIVGRGLIEKEERGSKGRTWRCRDTRCDHTRRSGQIVASRRQK